MHLLPFLQNEAVLFKEAADLEGVPAQDVLHNWDEDAERVLAEDGTLRLLFAEYALGYVSRLLGTELAVDIDKVVAFGYQEDRLREEVTPKSINEEVRFLPKILGDSGEVIRAS